VGATVPSVVRGDAHNGALGAFGERRAAAHYRAHGYAVLERNWRCRSGEIDLICARGTTLVVCEVKTRTGPGHGHPLEAVTVSKQRRLRRLAAAYLEQQGRRWAAIRFDVVAVLDGTIEVVEGAF
jgi:putative endonuclease